MHRGRHPTTSGTFFSLQDGTFDGVMSGDTCPPCNTCSLPSYQCTCDFAEVVDYYLPGGHRAILEQPNSQDGEATCSPLKFQVISAFEQSAPVPVSNSSPDVSDAEEEMLARRKRRKCHSPTLSESEASSDTAGVCDVHVHVHTCMYTCVYIYIDVCVCVCKDIPLCVCLCVCTCV